MDSNECIRISGVLININVYKVMLCNFKLTTKVNNTNHLQEPLDSRYLVYRIGTPQ